MNSKVLRSFEVIRSQRLRKKRSQLFFLKITFKLIFQESPLNLLTECLHSILHFLGPPNLIKSFSTLQLVEVADVPIVSIIDFIPQPLPHNFEISSDVFEYWNLAPITFPESSVALTHLAVKNFGIVFVRLVLSNLQLSLHARPRRVEVVHAFAAINSSRYGILSVGHSFAPLNTSGTKFVK